MTSERTADADVAMITPTDQLEAGIRDAVTAIAALSSAVQCGEPYTATLAAVENKGLHALASIAAVVGREQRLSEALNVAWTIIANAGEGDWTRETDEWREAAGRWRDEDYRLGVVA